MAPDVRDESCEISASVLFTREDNISSRRCDFHSSHGYSILSEVFSRALTLYRFETLSPSPLSFHMAESKTKIANKRYALSFFCIADDRSRVFART